MRLLPTPYSIALARRCANSDVASLFGGYKWIDDAMPLTKGKSFIYNKFNNVYVDVQKLQEAMIRFYGLTHDECGGKVAFVLKLDECQVVKGQRPERVSLTMMNRALVGIDVEVGPNTTIERKNECFGVQSEKNIWWWSSFCIPMRHMMH